MEKHNYNVIGLMSGTSLDGLDVALCRFTKNEGWEFEIIAAQTFDYPEGLTLKLAKAINAGALDLSLLNVELGIMHGDCVNAFLNNQSARIDFISSHGHTVFHQPQKGLTLQIGSPAHIAAKANLPVVADFRTLDVALGGQGAPLVPIGDKLLFPQFDYCLNLGGIANISYNQNGIRLAFDICPCNMVLNELANELGHDYDEDGRLARNGAIDDRLLAALNALDYYQQPAPKSLGKEFFDLQFNGILKSAEVSTADKMRTCAEHIARQIAGVAGNNRGLKMLVTGGGAFNTFLMERIAGLCGVEVVIPDTQIIQYKEALIFAFLGVLRWRGEVNCLATVTGAARDCCGGSIYAS